ncbi:NAD-dependent epimerase/dehydratase family protein [Sinorhizobium sp. BG8]|uniref:NAD-dependent epimerase/dehydratase family protein n=1 Tax=Sinorhizobium sp. BG8 TaxID=2613773 RepID=UPI00193D1028|nr:NAD-dependent epimerase/dehydratase family protein [Sinorhizobium sp. BG8]QRM56437.1 NAD-dependent epimerase/dehydratase family protein [Sinorhizobium sp. BG8]
MRYLITGTAGFIGFHLARRLLEDGHVVAGFDGMTPYYDVRLKEARHAALMQFPEFSRHIAMLEERERVNEAVAEARPDVIIHLAAQAGVRYSLENPEAYLDSNVTGSWNILEAAKASGCKHLLLASTSSVYGANSSIPFREVDRADEPLTIYAATKKSMELIAHCHAHLYKIPTTVFRFFTVYGPWGRPDMALFKFTKAILDGNEIEIYGEGKMSRDFTYIDDLVEAIVRLSHIVPSEANRVETPAGVETLSRIAPYRVVNIGGGQPRGLLEFVDELENALGRKALRKMLPMQQGDVPRTYASFELLSALTGFRPTTELPEGIRAFVKWYLETGRELTA